MKQQMVYPSDIANYALCPKIVYNRKVLGIYTKSTLGQALGLFEHETRRRFYTLVQNHIAVHTNGDFKTECFQSIAIQSVEESIPYVLLNYEFPYSTQKFKQSIVAKLIKESCRIYNQLVSGDSVELILPLAVEMSLRSANLRLAGRIDCLLPTIEGPIPVDFKTFGKNVETLPHELQITAYALLIEEKFNTQVNYGLVLYTEDDFARLIKVTSKRRLMVTNAVNAILEMLENKEIPDSRYSLMSCDSCDFNRVCSKGG
jgi:CRISPR-associated exonuclease Cas4